MSLDSPSSRVPFDPLYSTSREPHYDKEHLSCLDGRPKGTLTEVQSHHFLLRERVWMHHLSNINNGVCSFRDPFYPIL